MRRTPLVAVAISAALTALLTGCSEPEAATPAFTPAVTASAEPTPTSTSTAAAWDVGAGCAALSTVTSTVGNAMEDRAAGRITKGQRNAILSSTGPSFRLVQIGLDGSGPLAAPVDAIVALIPDKPKATKAGFDPASDAYSGALHRIAGICRANGTTLTGFAPFDG